MQNHRGALGVALVSWMRIVKAKIIIPVPVTNNVTITGQCDESDVEGMIMTTAVYRVIV